MLRLVADPGGFFDEESQQPSLLASVLVVLVAGIALNLNTLFTVPLMSRVLAADAARVAVPVTLIGAVTGVLGTFGLWFIYAGTLHTVSAVFGGEGSFRGVFLLVGWGFLPLAIHGIIGGIAFQFVISNAGAIPQEPQAFSQFLNSLRIKTPLVATSVGRFFFLAWQAVLWTHALSAARGLSRREAIYTVAVPVSVTVVVNGNQLLTTVGLL
jgi:hypothetical protein